MSSAKQSAATRARYAKRRQRRLAKVDNDLDATQWRTLVEAWEGCAYCGAQGVPLQKDCVQPISRGGRYTQDNVVPACASCNASKHNSEVTGWLRRKKLDERAFLLKHATILHALRPTEPAATAADDTAPAPPPRDASAPAR
ncbi:HNH endonuclease [Demequina sediminicola]|uniref:HNH endonuclease n=1 Tax=Demequina sediminicola TaxID=1095026 RepID=UPI0007805787|nr:HNH endonuclease signature motif containing protein [Demequina sediminicola]